MDLDGLRLFLRVIEVGSIQRAANALGISRSSLRRKLDNLEAQVGSELLLRSASGVALTPAGLVVCEEGRALLERSTRMIALAKARNDNAAGRITLVLPTGMPDAVRVVLTQALRAAVPGLCVDEREHEDPLEHRHEPFGLLFHFGDPPERGDWYSRTLTRLRLVPVATEAYLARHGRPATPADLAAHPLLSWPIARLDPRRWPLWSGGTIPIEPVFTSLNANVVHRAAQESMGILLGSAEPTHLPLRTPLVPVLPDEVGCEVALRCLSPAPSQTDPRSAAVLAGIEAFLGLRPP